MDVRGPAVTARHSIKTLPKRCGSEPTRAELIASSLEEDIVLGRRHPRERWSKRICATASALIEAMADWCCLN
jgi:hypothetical protein